MHQACRRVCSSIAVTLLAALSACDWFGTTSHHTLSCGSNLEAPRGDGQTGQVNMALGVTLSIRAMRTAGNALCSPTPLPGEQVRWVALTGAGTLSAVVTTTDASGDATSSWTLGPSRGQQTVQATWRNARYTFTATAYSAPYRALRILAGNNQTAPVGSALRIWPEAQLVTVKEAGGSFPKIEEPVHLGLVDFTVTSGGGRTDIPVRFTGLNGTAIVEWTLGPVAGAQGLRMVAGTGHAPDPRDTLQVDFTATAVTVPVDSVGVAPDQASIIRGNSLGLRARTYDAQRNELLGRSITWHSSNPTIASVAADGVVTGVSVGGPVTITASSEGKTGQALITVVPPIVASVVVTPSPVTVRTGSTSQLVAQALDVSRQPVPGQQFTWTSRDPAVATVDATGLVTAVSPGTADIEASTLGLTGTARLIVLPARIAWASVFVPFGSVIQPPAFNSAGGTVLATSLGRGHARVSFPGQQPLPGETETFIVTARGRSGDAYCKLASWGNGPGNTLDAEVRCFRFGGVTPLDSDFDITLLGDKALPGRFGYAFANTPSAPGPYSPTNSFNSTSAPSSPQQPIRVTRLGLGDYEVRFPGNAGGPNDPEAVHVAAVGTGIERCNLADVLVGEVVRVRCYSGQVNQGPSVDVPFAITLMERGPTGMRAGYAFAADANLDEFEDSGRFPLPSNRAYNSSGGAVDVERVGTGWFRVTFVGLAPPGAANYSVQVVDKDADDAMFCAAVQVDREPSNVLTDLVVTVNCWHADDGELEDEAFYVIIFIK